MRALPDKMYIVVIEEGCANREQEVHVFRSLVVARASVWKYIRRVASVRDEYDTIDATLYKTCNGSRCKLIDEFSDVALKDGYAEGWKSEGRREAEHQQWEAEREAEREWRAKYVAIPIERHAD